MIPRAEPAGRLYGESSISARMVFPAFNRVADQPAVPVGELQNDLGVWVPGADIRRLVHEACARDGNCCFAWLGRWTGAGQGLWVRGCCRRATPSTTRMDAHDKADGQQPNSYSPTSASHRARTEPQRLGSPQDAHTLLRDPSPSQGPPNNGDKLRTSSTLNVRQLLVRRPRRSYRMMIS
jgi:hypothetical protein